MSRAITTKSVWTAHRSDILKIVGEARARDARVEAFFGVEPRLFGAADRKPDGTFSFRWLGPSEATGTITFDADLRSPRATIA
jgi:hypothetical protein